MRDVLGEIAAYKAREIEAARALVSERDLEARASEAEPARALPPPSARSSRPGSRR
jgi:hypothetical protein